MNIEAIREYCLSLPHVTEDIKWEVDLCFCIGGKMFCVAILTSEPLKVSFKVEEDEFTELTQTEYFSPAPYMARHHWVLLEDTSKAPTTELKNRIALSYEMAKAKLPKKILKNL
jgi:predicted DNA-binding protein (MmcQ/YjbR family)